MVRNKYVSWIAAASIVAGMAVVIPAFAQTTSANPGTHAGWGNGSMGHMAMHRPGMGSGVFGTVSAVNGTTLTVTEVMGSMRMKGGSEGSAPVATTTVVYTVDASNATIVKNGASSTIASIATGDRVMVQGTVSGTNVTATTIRDGFVPMGAGGFGRGFGHPSSSTSTFPVQGNGEPVIGGSIASVSGTTVTVTNASNVTYTVDASNAKIVRNGTTTVISSLAVGDNVVIQGTVNGTSVAASSIIDQAAAPQANAGSHGGFFGSIGNFFKKLFGF